MLQTHDSFELQLQRSKSQIVAVLKAWMGARDWPLDLEHKVLQKHFAGVLGWPIGPDSTDFIGSTGLKSSSSPSANSLFSRESVLRKCLPGQLALLVQKTYLIWAADGFTSFCRFVRTATARVVYARSQTVDLVKRWVRAFLKFFQTSWAACYPIAPLTPGHFLVAHTLSFECWIRFKIWQQLKKEPSKKRLIQNANWIISPRSLPVIRMASRRSPLPNAKTLVSCGTYCET